MPRSVLVAAVSVLASALLTILFPAPAHALSTFVDGWDDGSQNGWTADATSAALEVRDNGGAPQGYLSSQSNGGIWSGIQTLKAEATGPAPSSGDISVDLRFETRAPNELYFRLRASSERNGWIFHIDPSLLGTEWQTFTTTFDPDWSDGQATAAGWEQESRGDSWSLVMSDIHSLAVRSFSTGPPVAMNYDNLAVNVVPEPHSAGLLALALAGLAALRRRGD